MKVNTVELVEALKKIQPGLATSEIIEQTSFFIFNQSEIQTFNDEICIITPDPTEGAIEGAVPSAEFFSILSKIDAEDVDLSQDGDEVKIKTKKLEALLKIEEEIVVPFEDVDTIEDDDQWEKIPGNFFDALKTCQYATSKVSSRYPLMAYIMVTPKFMQATNGYRLSKYKFSSKLKHKDFLIPQEVIPILTSANFKGLNEIARSDGWIHFRNDDGVILSTRTIENAVHKFPPVDKVLADKEVIGEVKLKEEQTSLMKKALSRSLVFANRKEEKDTIVKLSFKGKKIILSAKSTKGWIKEQIKHTKKLDDIEIEINPNLLHDVLSTCRTFSIQTNRVMFETDEYQHGIVIK